jgi:hypothetical protein
VLSHPTPWTPDSAVPCRASANETEIAISRVETRAPCFSFIVVNNGMLATPMGRISQSLRFSFGATTLVNAR